MRRAIQITALWILSRNYYITAFLAPFVLVFMVLCLALCEMVYAIVNTHWSELTINREEYTAIKNGYSEVVKNKVNNKI